MANRSTHTESITVNTKAIEAIGKYLADMPSLKIDGITFTPTELKARLQAESDAVKALASGRAALTQLIQDVQEAKDVGHVTRQCLRSWLLGTFGVGEVKMLEEFGFKPAVRAPRTVEAKIAAVAKAKATRLARHTMGKKQRLAIKAPVQPAAPTDPVVVTGH